MSQKDYELLIYNQMRNLEKVKEEILKNNPKSDSYGSPIDMLLIELYSLENDLRARFGNNRKLDYLLSLKK